MVEPHCVVGAGDAGAGDAIGIAAAELRDLGAGVASGVFGGGDQHRLDAMRPGRSGEGRGLEQRHVGDEHAVDARLGGARGRKRRGPGATTRLA